MDVPLPDVLFEYDEWELHIREHVPALAKLWQQGKHEQYNSYKTMAGLDYESYFKKERHKAVFTFPYKTVRSVNVKGNINEDTNTKDVH